MKILIVGSGGREHALAWTLAQSPQHPSLFIAPGNAGTAALGQNIPIGASDLDGLCGFVVDEQVDLVVVGPEQPLVMGLADRLEAIGVPVVGPSADAARLEGSKAFSKTFMDKYGIPTARFRTFSRGDLAAALAYLEEEGAPIVVKASGLAAGKGAIVCTTLEEARTAVEQMLRDGSFGDAGAQVVIEAFMEGEEASIFALTDGEDYVLMAPAQDHKRIGEGDTGQNTGGMGAYAPAPVVTPDVLDRVCEKIIEPTLAGMRAEGCPYKGILYVGLMIGDGEERVVEYNCRLGDPEAQVVLPLADGDLAEVFMKMAQGRLAEVTLRTRAGAAACVVMASAGYPGAYEKGYPIEGVPQANAREHVYVFEAGTRNTEEGTLVTNGGRVLAVSALGQHLEQALTRAYQGVAAIGFEGAQYRRDIGQKGLQRLALMAADG